MTRIDRVQMRDWPPESGYQPDDRMCCEVYLNNPKEHPQGAFIIEVYEADPSPLGAGAKEKAMKRKKTIIALAVFCLFTIGTASAQDLSSYESLKTPRLAKMPRQRMLVVEAKGDPNVAAKDAFGLLFKAFFSLKGVRMSAPRARWVNIATDPKDEWVGLYGLPIPDSVVDLPEGTQGVRIEAWDYGEVAEILHIGPYSEEIPTIEKLHAFIKESGYEIAGPHEEEYLKGPGMAASPADYWTVIRYPVKKREGGIAPPPGDDFQGI